MDTQLPSWNKLLEALLESRNDRPFKYINEATPETISETMANSAIVIGRYVVEGYRYSIQNERQKVNSDITETEINELTNKEIIDRIRDIFLM